MNLRMTHNKLAMSYFRLTILLNRFNLPIFTLSPFSAIPLALVPSTVPSLTILTPLLLSPILPTILSARLPRLGGPLLGLLVPLTLPVLPEVTVFLGELTAEVGTEACLLNEGGPDDVGVGPNLSGGSI